MPKYTAIHAPSTSQITCRTPQPLSDLVNYRRCPHCHTRLLEAIQPGAHRFDPVLSALIDHLLLIETELASVRELIEEVVR